jgi:hypothetical protein
MAPSEQNDGVLFLLEKEIDMKINRLIDRLNAAVRKTAQAASDLTLHAAASNAPKPPVIGRRPALPTKGIAKPPRKKAKATPAGSGRTGRPKTCGRFETRADLEAFVLGSHRNGHSMLSIANEARISPIVARRIITANSAAAAP